MRLRSKHRRTDSLYHLIGPEVFRTISKAVSPLLFTVHLAITLPQNSSSRSKPFVRFREKVSVSPKKQMRIGSVDARNAPLKLFLAIKIALVESWG